MAVIILMLIIGLVLIIKGGDFFVDSAAWMAEVSGIPKLIVGATVVSFATTLPELLVSSMAAAQGKIDMAVGNAVGSVTSNIAMIMAFGLIFIPSVIERRDYAVKSFLMLGSAAVLCILCLGGSLSIWSSAILLVFFVAAMYENISKAVKAVKSGNDKNETVDRSRRSIAVNCVKFVLGIAGIIVGARLLVDYGTELATILGVSQRIIALTIVAIGTSLPELVTTITAIVKKQSALSIGNIIGANIIDLSLILPVSAFISGSSLTVPRQSFLIDMPFCLFVGCIALIPTLITKKFSRTQGVVLLIFYLTYITLSCIGIM